MSKDRFVTLFDASYFSRGAELIDSLFRTVTDPDVWVYALDIVTEDLIRERFSKSVKIIPIAEVENDNLEELKKVRSHAEYCWTLTPHVISHALERSGSHDTVTYVDADVWILKSPTEILAEFSSSSCDVLVTEHDYFYAYDLTETSGRFCVQFMSFKNQPSSREILETWQLDCDDWCFARAEAGKYGDQGYLTNWPEEYPGRVMIQPGSLFQGPWNAQRFSPFEAITYHFHGLRAYGGGDFGVGVYLIPNLHRQLIYRPYLRLIGGRAVRFRSVLVSSSKIRQEFRDWFARLRVVYQFLRESNTFT